ncbi:hypothetical protein ACOMHN_015446 [Nucella lapillus]
MRGEEAVAYTLVCDHVRDCWGGGDERFCVFPSPQGAPGGEGFVCSGDRAVQCGMRHECFRVTGWCDGREDCVHGEDESMCVEAISECHDEYVLRTSIYRPSPPAVLLSDGYGKFRFTRSSNISFPTEKYSVSVFKRHSIFQIGCSTAFYGRPPSPEFYPALSTSERPTVACPATHFQCPHNGYCLPVFLRCNGVNDCPGREEEEGCAEFRCPGYYRCHGSQVCVHPAHLCDGQNQCPRKDDEWLCRGRCPRQCACYGLAYTCPRAFQAPAFPHLRYLDGTDSGMTPPHLRHLLMLVYLRLSRCGLNHTGALNFPNLVILDLSANSFTHIAARHFNSLTSLASLRLSHNPLQASFHSKQSDPLYLRSVKRLDLSGIGIREFNTSVLRPFPRLEILNLSSSGVQLVTGPPLGVLHHLRSLDLRGCPLTQFPRDVVRHALTLHTVFTDNYKLCCSQVLSAGFDAQNSHGPRDVVSSCGFLLGSSFYRTAFAVCSVCIVLGELLFMVVCVTMERCAAKSSAGVVLSHLAGCDLLMGVHSALVALTDARYRGRYLWADIAWRHSVLCQAGGCLFALSTHLSLCLTALLTLDGCLVSCRPRSSLRVSTRRAHLTCVALWTAGLCVSGAPLVPGWPLRGLYSATGLCQPLPALQPRSPADEDSLTYVITIVATFSLLTLLGQLLVVHVAGQRGGVLRQLITGRAQCPDVLLAMRLSTMVIPDTLCGLLLYVGVLLPGAGDPSGPSGLWVHTATLLWSFKSTVCFPLYLLGYVREQQRQKQREQLLKRLGRRK